MGFLRKIVSSDKIDGSAVIKRLPMGKLYYADFNNKADYDEVVRKNGDAKVIRFVGINFGKGA